MFLNPIFQSSEISVEKVFSFQSRRLTNDTPRLFTNFREANNGGEEGTRMNFALKLIYEGGGGMEIKFLADDSTE